MTAIYYNEMLQSKTNITNIQMKIIMKQIMKKRNVILSNEELKDERELYFNNDLDD